MAKLLISYQSHVGGEIRSVPGKEFVSNTWPRQSVNSKWWKWKTVISFQWNDQESINMLEARALLQSLRWRSKSSYFVGSRVIHLLDSQVVLGALKKYRSPAPHLHRLISRAAAICITASAKAVYAFVPTEWNPADKASRAGAQWGSLK